MHPLAHTAMPLGALPGVTWPAVPAAEGARMLAMQFQFAQSECWSPPQLRTARPLTPEEEEKPRAVIVRHLGDPFNVVFVHRDAIARSAEGKYEEFRSEVTA